jgi:hypothetical protein
MVSLIAIVPESECKMPILMVSGAAFFSSLGADGASEGWLQAAPDSAAPSATQAERGDGRGDDFEPASARDDHVVAVLAGRRHTDAFPVVRKRFADACRDGLARSSSTTLPRARPTLATLTGGPESHAAFI